MPQLTWLGDSDARRASRRVPYRILEPVETVGDPKAENLLIQGDNLEALKALLPFYAGRVKCIFIDPPYNTKSAFEHYDDNLEHSQWLSMMYPRLELLRELLSEDGSIWVTIDDNESHYLKVIMDEVFGRFNFVANVVWQKKYTVANDAKWLSESHDHVIAFAKNKAVWRPNRLERTEAMNERYRNPDNHPKGVWKSTPLYAKRTGSDKEQAFTYTFKNGVSWTTPRGTSPRFPVSFLKRLDENNEIWFGADGRATPSRKTFLQDLTESGPPASTIWLHSDVGNNHEARDEVKLMNPDDPFATPKPERLLRRVVQIASSTGDLVLDSFLGSGTTAAVAHKMGRRWIGIEMGDHARTHCLPRLKKVIEGEQGGVSESVGWKGGGGFRYMKLGAKAFFDDGALNADIRFKDLAAYLWFLETRAPHPTGKFTSPLLGTHDGTAYVLLYNGIIADRRPESGNVLTTAVWNDVRSLLPRDRRETVIYGEASRFSDPRLKDLKITFKQIPYDVGMR